MCIINPLPSHKECCKQCYHSNYCMKPPKINFSTNFLEPSWVAISQLSLLRICNTITSDCRYISDVCFVHSATGIDLAFVVINELRSLNRANINWNSTLYCYWAISLVLRVGRTRLILPYGQAFFHAESRDCRSGLYRQTHFSTSNNLLHHN